MGEKMKLETYATAALIGWVIVCSVILSDAIIAALCR
jgi:hypothetical protein